MSQTKILEAIVDPRAKMWVVLVGAAAVVALTARYARTERRRLAVCTLAAVITLLMYASVKSEFDWLDAAPSAGVGITASAALWVLHGYRDPSVRDRLKDMLVAFAISATVGVLVFYVPPLFLTTPEELAQQAAVRELQVLGSGDLVSTYNSLNARLKENMSFADAVPLLKQLHGLFESARIERVDFAEGSANADVIFSVERGSGRHLLLKQEWFSGLTRITDGHIESLASYTNFISIGDILVDGRSVFQE